jgi:hypothetical protein
MSSMTSGGWMRRCAVGTAVGFALCLAGAAGSPADPAPAHYAPSVNCETRNQVISRAPARSRKDVRIGPVTIYRAQELAEWPHRYLQPEANARFAFVKIPFIVDAGPGATIALRRASRRHALIDVGRDQGPGVSDSEVKLVPCPPGAEVAGRPVGPRTIFTGGFRIEGPQCLHLSVSGEDYTVAKTIGLGIQDCG